MSKPDEETENLVSSEALSLIRGRLGQRGRHRLQLSQVTSIRGLLEVLRHTFHRELFYCPPHLVSWPELSLKV